MGHRGKDMISPKEDMIDLKCSPLSNSQDMGCHIEAHGECLQHRLETIQSFGRLILVPLLQDNVPAQLVELPLASKRNNYSLLQTRAGLMLSELPIYPHSQRFPMTNTMQIMRPMICLPGVGPKANPQSA
jgi:hypothetical protein